MKDKRSIERRRWDRLASFPLIDCEGKLVTHNRRRTVERRVRRELRAKELRLRFQGRDFIMRETSILLGRQSECAIVVADPLVSRQHVRIERRGDQYVLADTSRNGTYVQFHGSQQVHHVKQGELVLSLPGMLLMGRVFAGQGYEQNIVYFDMA